jgi:hypothetical protein
MDIGSKYKTEMIKQFLRIDDNVINRIELRLVAPILR